MDDLALCFAIIFGAATGLFAFSFSPKVWELGHIEAALLMPAIFAIGFVFFAMRIVTPSSGIETKDGEGDL